MKKYIVSDIHGCYDTFMLLLQKAARELGITTTELIKDLVIAGDLIDRGPKSREVVEFAIKNDVACIQGNHERMAIDALNDISKIVHWHYNGAASYVNQFFRADQDKTHEDHFFDPELKEQIRWMESLPLKLEYPEVQVNGRKLVVTHSWLNGLSDELDAGDSKDLHLLWNRPYKSLDDMHYGNCRVTDTEGVFNVFGHTCMGEPEISEFHANIDGGGFLKRYAKNGSTLGRLNLLVVPTLEVISHECVES